MPLIDLPVVDLKALAVLCLVGYGLFWALVFVFGFFANKNKTRITHKEPD